MVGGQGGNKKEGMNFFETKSCPSSAGSDRKDRNVLFLLTLSTMHKVAMPAWQQILHVVLGYIIVCPGTTRDGT